MIRKNHKRYAVGLVAFVLIYLITVQIGVDYVGIIGLSAAILAKHQLGFSEKETYLAFAHSLRYIQLLLPVTFLFSALFSNLPRRTSRFAQLAKYFALISSVFTILDSIPISLSGPSFSVYVLILFSGFFLQILVFSLARQLAKAPDISLRLTPTGSIACASVIFVILFSVTSFIAVIFQAQRVADGQPYCIAMADKGKSIRPSTSKEHGRIRVYGRMRSWEILRGTRFTTSRTGYKSTSKWYFHAVLIVGRPGGAREYWNWSISKLNFHKIRRVDLQIVSPANGCNLSRNFFLKLPWI